MTQIALKKYFLNSTLLLSNHYYTTAKFKIPKFHLIYWNPLKREPKQIKKPFAQSIHKNRESVI